MTADCRYIETAGICPNCGGNVWNKSEQTMEGLHLWRECEMCRSVFDEGYAVTTCSVSDTSVIAYVNADTGSGSTSSVDDQFRARLEWALKEYAVLWRALADA